MGVGVGYVGICGWSFGVEGISSVKDLDPVIIDEMVKLCGLQWHLQSKHLSRQRMEFQ